MSSLFSCVPTVPPALDGWTISGTSSGLVLGSTDDGSPFTLDLFRARPTRVVSVGGVYLATLLVVRAVLAGARVVVLTHRDAAWKHLADTAGIPESVLSTGMPGAELPRAEVRSPVLVVHDTGSVPHEQASAPVQWRPVLHVLPGVHPAAVSLLTGADALILQPMDSRQAEQLGRLIDLRPAVVAEIEELDRTELAVLVKGTGYRITLSSTADEIDILGPPRLR